MQGANRRYNMIPWAAQNAVHPVTQMSRGEGVYILMLRGINISISRPSSSMSISAMATPR